MDRLELKSIALSSLFVVLALYGLERVTNLDAVAKFVAWLPIVLKIAN